MSKDLIELPYVCDRPNVSHLRLPRQLASANGATTPGFSGPFPSQCVLLQPTLIREYLFVCGSWVAFSLGCQPGSSESAPCVTWSVFGSPPLRTVRHCTGQVATDPQSPMGGSQRACPTRGAHPTASGRFSSVALFKQSYPALAVRKRSLWDASPGDMSEPPFSDRSLGRRPSVTLFQRGTACFRLKARRSNFEIDLCSNRFELCDVRNTSAHRKRLTRELVGQIPQVKILGDLSAHRQCQAGPRLPMPHRTCHTEISNKERNVKTHDEVDG